MRLLVVFCIVLASLAAAGAQAPDLSPERLRTLPEQAQVRVLGRVTGVGSREEALRIEANGMTFSVERGGSVRIPRLQPGDRVLVTGELQPGGKILLDSLQPIRPSEQSHPLVGTLLSVNQRRRRLVLKGETGQRVSVNFRPDTTFVRLGRRSRATELRYGDRIWVDRAAEGPAAATATRVEVVDAKEGRINDVGVITAVDTARRQLRVRFTAGARAVLLGQAGSPGAAFAPPIRSLKVGQRVRVVGDERRGVVVARRLEPVPAEAQPSGLIGRIQSIDTTARVLRLRTQSTQPVTTRVRVPTSARIEAAGRPLPLRSLRVGDRVRVQGQAQPDRSFTARQIQRL